MINSIDKFNAEKSQTPDPKCKGINKFDIFCVYMETSCSAYSLNWKGNNITMYIKHIYSTLGDSLNFP